MRCDLSQLLSWKITKRIHSSKPASLNRPVGNWAKAGNRLITLWDVEHYGPSPHEQSPSNVYPTMPSRDHERMGMITLFLWEFVLRLPFSCQHLSWGHPFSVRICHVTLFLSEFVLRSPFSCQILSWGHPFPVRICPKVMTLCDWQDVKIQIWTYLVWDVEHMALCHTDSPQVMCTQPTLPALLSGTFLQTLPNLVTPLKGHSLSPHSCPATQSAPSERIGY